MKLYTGLNRSQLCFGTSKIKRFSSRKCLVTWNYLKRYLREKKHFKLCQFKVTKKKTLTCAKLKCPKMKNWLILASRQILKIDLNLLWCQWRFFDLFSIFQSVNHQPDCRPVSATLTNITQWCKWLLGERKGSSLAHFCLDVQLLLKGDLNDLGNTSI